MDTVFDNLRRRAYVGDTDDALLGRFAATGDDGAFSELVRRHGPMVYAAARRRLPDPADAADVFQATFLVLVRKAHRLSGRPSVGPWLYRVAALTARNLRRKNARRPGRLADAAGRSSDPALRWDLDDALLSLSERDRAAVVLCHLLGHTRQEAADRLGLPEGTLSTILYRAIRRLRVRLGHDPRPLLTASGVVVPAGVVAAAGRTATAAWAAGLSAAGPGVASLAGGTLRTLGLWKMVVAGLAAAACLGAGAGLGLAVRSPTPVTAPAVATVPRVGIHVGDRPTGPILWRDGDTSTTVRDADALRVLLERVGRRTRVDLTADAGADQDVLLAVARACVAADFPAVHYAGPLPAFSESLGTETHDWGRADTRTEPAVVHLPTAFGLHRPAAADARASAFVGRLKGVVTRDDTRPGRPVVGVSLAATPLADAQVRELAPLTDLTTLNLARTAVTDAGLTDLAPLTGLTVLDLSHTAVTDAGLPALARLPRLAALDLTGTRVTDAGAELLRRAVPGCHVRR